MRTNIENSILSTFLFANDMGENLDNVFKLDISIFKSKYRQRVAEQINNVTDGFYDTLRIEMAEKSKTTKYEQEFIDLIAQIPITLPVAHRYYKKIVDDDRLESLC